MIPIGPDIIKKGVFELLMVLLNGTLGATIAFLIEKFTTSKKVLISIVSCILVVGAFAGL